MSLPEILKTTRFPEQACKQGFQRNKTEATRCTVLDFTTGQTDNFGFWFVIPPNEQTTEGGDWLS